MMFTDEEIARAIFIRDHHHLMSPWGYSAREIVAANRKLFLRGCK